MWKYPPLRSNFPSSRTFSGLRATEKLHSSRSHQNCREKSHFWFPAIWDFLFPLCFVRHQSKFSGNGAQISKSEPTWPLLIVLTLMCVRMCILSAFSVSHYRKGTVKGHQSFKQVHITMQDVQVLDWQTNANLAQKMQKDIAQPRWSPHLTSLPRLWATVCEFKLSLR